MLSPSALLTAIMSASSTTPFLDALQLVAGARQHQREEEIGHVGDRGLGLADADGLDQDDIEARGLAQEHRLARLGGDAAERAGRQARGG